MSETETGSTLERPTYYFVVAMLHDVEKDRYHPMVYKPSPQPSWSKGDTMRFKSMGHHTEGFDTHELALESAEAMVVDINEKIESGEGNLSMWGDKAYPCLEKSFPWDGQGVPASVNFFGFHDTEDKVLLIM